MYKVTVEKFYAVIGPQDVTSSVCGNYPYTTIFQTRHGKEVGRRVDHGTNEKSEYFLNAPEGYRLHIEGVETEPTAFATMALLRAEQRRLAKEYGRSFAQIEAMSYIIDEQEYQNGMEYKAELAAQR